MRVCRGLLLHDEIDHLIRDRGVHSWTRDREPISVPFYITVWVGTEQGEGVPMKVKNLFRFSLCFSKGLRPYSLSNRISCAA